MREPGSVFLLAALSVPAGAAPRVPDIDTSHDRPSGFTAKLAAGATPGTYDLAVRGEVRVAGPDAPLPVAIVLRRLNGEVAARVVVDRVGSYDIEADVAPGEWWVLVLVGRAHVDRWWDDVGAVLRIDEAGGLACASNCAPRTALTRKLTFLSPQENAVVAEPQPVLSWRAVPGATGYGLTWFDLSAPDEMKTPTWVSGTSWPFSTPLVPGHRYQWSVVASDDASVGPSHVLAQNTSEFTAAGTGVAEPVVRVDRWIGLSFEIGRSTVSDVAPGSPAAAAGFVQGDEVLTFGDRAIRDIRGLIEAVSATPIGAEVRVVVASEGRRITRRVVVGERPKASGDLDSLRP